MSDNKKALKQCEQDRENEKTNIEQEDDSRCDCGGELEEEYFWVNGIKGEPTGDVICSDCEKRYKSHITNL